MEFEARIDAALEDPDGMVPGVLAEELIASASGDEFETWLMERGPGFLASYVSARLRAVRAVMVHRAKARAFGVEATKENPDFSVFKATFRVNREGLVKSLGKMESSDLRYVAQRYAATAKEAALMATFYRRIANEIGDKTVEEVFTEESWEERMASFIERAGIRQSVGGMIDSSS